MAFDKLQALPHRRLDSASSSAEYLTGDEDKISLGKFAEIETVVDSRVQYRSIQNSGKFERPGHALSIWSSTRGGQALVSKHVSCGHVTLR